MPPQPSVSSRRDLRLYLIMSVVALAVIGADVLVLSRAEAQPTEAVPAATTDAPETSTPAPAAPEASPDASPEVAAVDEANRVPAAEEGAGQACAFDATAQPVAAWQSLIDVREPVFGNRNANVTVIEFFEPNCPHCASLHPAMQATERQFRRQARFVYKPVVFWPRSSLQTQALYAAGQENPAKFQRLLALQMQRQKPEGFNEAEVRAMVREAGMNADALMQRINGGLFRGHILAYREAFGRTGSNNVPLILINGRQVGANRTPACMGQLIQQVTRG